MAASARLLFFWLRSDDHRVAIGVMKSWECRQSCFGKRRAIRKAIAKTFLATAWAMQPQIGCHGGRSDYSEGLLLRPLKAF